MQSISCVGSANWRDAQLHFSLSKSCIRVNCFAVAIMGSVAHSCNGNHRANVKLLKVSCLVENQNCDVRKSANFATVRSGLAEEDIQKRFTEGCVVLKRCSLK